MPLDASRATGWFAPSAVSCGECKTAPEWATSGYVRRDVRPLRVMGRKKP